MGAHVLRVEQLGGGIDAGRWPTHAGRSLYRAGLDQGKRSIAMDLRSAHGQEIVTNLILAGGESGGILISNLGARGWMSYERLAQKRSDLIMISITGVPGGGSAVDYTVNAGVGFPWITGPRDLEGPVNHVLPAWDITTGVMAATAVLAAERHRRLTGAGQLVEIALSDVALAVAMHLGYLAEARLVDEPRGRFGNDIFGSYGREFRTRDGRYVMVCALTPRHWTSLGAATGLADAFQALGARHGVNLLDESERFLHRDEIHALVAPWVAERTLAEVADQFKGQDVLWGPYRSFKQVVGEDPAAADPYASPMHFHGFSRAKAPPAPLIGADTHSLLQSELNMDSTQLADLRDRGVIE
jgi:2-methylfumaryl-CoA isomerase